MEGITVIVCVICKRKYKTNHITDYNLCNRCQTCAVTECAKKFKIGLNVKENQKLYGVRLCDSCLSTEDKKIYAKPFNNK